MHFYAPDGRHGLLPGNPVKPAAAHSDLIGSLRANGLSGGGASVKQVQTVLGIPRPSSRCGPLHLWPGDEDRTRSIADATFGVLRTGCGLDSRPANKTAGQEG